jgi:hypothetical protein
VITGGGKLLIANGVKALWVSDIACSEPRVDITPNQTRLNFTGRSSKGRTPAEIVTKYVIVKKTNNLIDYIR